MRVLCVAEKPSAAKAIASILSQSAFTIVNTLLQIHTYVCVLLTYFFLFVKRRTGDDHVKNFDFTYNFSTGPASVVMTALKGHLLELSFEGGINKSWNDYPIEDLFFTPIVKTVSNHLQPIADNLKSEIRRADVLFIWTDGDREGEAIGGDVADLCRSVKPNITVWRAHFSSMLAP